MRVRPVRKRSPRANAEAMQDAKRRDPQSASACAAGKKSGGKGC